MTDRGLVRGHPKINSYFPIPGWDPKGVSRPTAFTEFSSKISNREEDRYYWDTSARALEILRDEFTKEGYEEI